MNNPHEHDQLPDWQREILAEVSASFIFAYTRADAIADGVLVPIPELDARIAGFLLPMAVNESVYAAAKAGELEHRQEMLAQCFAAVHCRQNKDTDCVYFNLRLPEGGTMKVVLHCGPGDNHEPVLTLCQPQEL